MKELKSKQRAYLMKLASSLEPIFQIGKSSLTPECTAAIAEALFRRSQRNRSYRSRAHTLYRCSGHRQENRSLQREQRPQKNRTSPVTVILPMDKGGSL